jgi:hypothetical protein
MKIALVQWKAHRALVDRARVLRPFARRSGRRLLFLTVKDAICHTQVFPYFFHAGDFAREHNLQLRELPLEQFNQGRNPYQGERVDAVAFQTWFDLTPEQMSQLVYRIRAAWPGAKLAYLDWFAPADLRYAAVLTPEVDIYVKKQVLKSRDKYGEPTIGDTNLTDYYCKRFGIDLPTTNYLVPAAFWDKLHLGTHFAFSDYMLPRFEGNLPACGERTIDVHARMAVTGTQWYASMRREALEAVQSLEGQCQVVSRGHVSKKHFLGEMLVSKLCFSPFGYGEVCWRDFEAMFAGSVLLKPDMSHLICHPAAFLANETYVPLRWDLSDLPDKVDYFLSHESERVDIARAAFSGLHRYLTEQQFVRDSLPMLRKLQIQ